MKTMSCIRGGESHLGDARQMGRGVPWEMGGFGFWRGVADRIYIGVGDDISSMVKKWWTKKILAIKRA